MLRTMSVPFHSNPLAIAAALEMSATLEDVHYSPHARDRIVRHAAATGTLAGSLELDREDEAAAEAAFVDALRVVPYDSPAWDLPDAFIDVDSLLGAGGGPDDDATEPPDDWRGSSHAGWAMLAPIAGGAPDDEPFMPSDDDQRDYAEWSAALEARRDAEDRAYAAWCARIDQLNADRVD